MKYHYTSLRVFQTADNLAHEIFDICKLFPKDQQFVVTSQLQRAVLSIVLNIVEGNAKRMSSNKDFIRFLKISLGSLYETEYLLYFSKKHNYIDENKYKEICLLKDHCSSQLWKLIVSLEKRVSRYTN